MKKITTRSFFGLAIATLIGASLTLTSCSEKKANHDNDDVEDADDAENSNPGSDIEFVSFCDSTIVSSADLSSFDENTGYATITLSGLYPKEWGNVDIKPLQKQLNHLAFNIATDDFSKALKYYPLHTRLVSDTAKVELTPDAKVSDTNVSTDDVKIAVQYMDPELLSLSVFNYTYFMGAAHGMYSTEYVNFYAPTAQVITADNIFKTSNAPEIINAIREEAREQYSESATGITASSIESFDNFYIQPGYIVFVYAPYEIGPFSAGEVEVRVRSYDFYDYFTPFGLKVFGF